jgi:hypothetical protein
MGLGRVIERTTLHHFVNPNDTGLTALSDDSAYNCINSAPQTNATANFIVFLSAVVVTIN